MFFFTLCLLLPVFAQRVYKPTQTADALKGYPDVNHTPGSCLDFVGFETHHRLTGLTVDFAGSVYYADTEDCVIYKFAPDGKKSIVAGKKGSAGNQDGPLASAAFRYISGATADHGGNIYVSDVKNSVIKKVVPRE